MSLYQLKVALMIVMWVEPTRPTGKRANTMTDGELTSPSRRHEHTGHVAHRAYTMTDGELMSPSRRHENTF